MPKYTENLNLFKYDVPNDGNRPFDIETSLNENWDKIDTFSQENNLQNKITNCITEIPQRIKLELNNGVLTLKAGSVVTVPNGFEEDGVTPKFEYVTIESDLSITQNWNGQVLAYVAFNNDFSNPSLITYALANSASGDGNSIPNNTQYYYTTTNLIRRKNTTVDENYKYCFPLALCTVTNGKISTINNIFNGLGYIGSTVWVDKDVKFLIPDGRNSDGTLNNLVKTVPRCLAFTMPSVADASFPEVTCAFEYFKDSTTKNLNQHEGFNLSWWSNQNIFYMNKLPASAVAYTRVFVLPENIWYCYINSQWYKFYAVPITNAGVESTGKFNKMTTPETVELVKRSDSSWLNGLGMPSDKYINLTLGATGSAYTAPANGWFYIHKRSNGTNQFLSLQSYVSSIVSQVVVSTSGTEVGAYLPARKGDQIGVYYNMGGQTNYFRFVYAEGAQ